MSEKTHAEIIAEMRRRHFDVWVSEFRSYADRLEAAHKRESDELRKKVGNAAKLREAVIGLRDRISMFYKNEWIPYDEWEGANDDANSALAAPPRNCDVGTAEEQTERWNNENPYPYEWDDRQYYDALYMLKWAQMPYESEVTMASEIKLKLCPFCGSRDVKIYSPKIDGEWMGYRYPECPKCHAKIAGVWLKTYRQAADAWNRRVK